MGPDEKKVCIIAHARIAFDLACRTLRFVSYLVAVYAHVEFEAL